MNSLACLLLLDLRLPRVDGLEVLSQIKNNDRIQSLPVIVFSSSDDPLDIQRAYRLGANSYLVKPMGFSEMSTMLQQAYRYWIETNTPNRGFMKRIV